MRRKKRTLWEEEEIGKHEGVESRGGVGGGGTTGEEGRRGEQGEVNLGGKMEERGGS